MARGGAEGAENEADLAFSLKSPVGKGVQSKQDGCTGLLLWHAEARRAQRMRPTLLFHQKALLVKARKASKTAVLACCYGTRRRKERREGWLLTKKLFKLSDLSGSAWDLLVEV